MRRIKTNIVHKIWSRSEACFATDAHLDLIQIIRFDSVEHSIRFDEGKRSWHVQLQFSPNVKRGRHFSHVANRNLAPGELKEENCRDSFCEYFSSASLLTGSCRFEQVFFFFWTLNRKSAWVTSEWRIAHAAVVLTRAERNVNATRPETFHISFICFATLGLLRDLTRRKNAKSNGEDRSYLVAVKMISVLIIKTPRLGCGHSLRRK